METSPYGPKWSNKLLKITLGTSLIVHPFSVLSFPPHEVQRLDPSIWISPPTWLYPNPRPGTMGIGSELWFTRLKFPFTYIYNIDATSDQPNRGSDGSNGRLYSPGS